MLHEERASLAPAELVACVFAAVGVCGAGCSDETVPELEFLVSLSVCSADPMAVTRHVWTAEHPQ